jgi:hypothetical protein
MTAFAAVHDHAYRGRWPISATVVLLMHLAIAAAVVATWRRSTESFGPVVIELAPALPDRQAGPPPTPPSVTTSAPPERPIGKLEGTTEPKTAVGGEEKVGSRPPGEGGPPGASGTTTPSAGARGGQVVRTPAAPGGSPVLPARPGVENPIDLRIAEPPRLRFRRAGPTILGRPAFSVGPPGSAAAGVGKGPLPPLGSLAARQRALAPYGPRSPSVHGGVARNAVGIPVPAIEAAVGAKGGLGDHRLPRVSAAAGIARNPVAALPLPRNTGSGPTPKAANAAAGNSHPGLGPVASTGTPIVGVNGARMIRPGAGTGAIGGPAKPAAGVLNGTTFKRN